MRLRYTDPELTSAAGEQSGLDSVWLPDHFVVAASSGMARLRVDRKSG